MENIPLALAASGCQRGSFEDDGILTKLTAFQSNTIYLRETKDTVLMQCSGALAQRMAHYPSVPIGHLLYILSSVMDV